MDTSKVDLIVLIKRANEQRDLAEQTLYDYKRSVYTHVAQVYEEAVEMFGENTPGFIIELAKAHGVNTELDEYEGYPDYQCEHDRYSTTSHVMEHEPTGKECINERCDNCNAVVKHTCEDA
jgi:hypothetical protein